MDEIVDKDYSVWRLGQLIDEATNMLPEEYAIYLDIQPGGISISLGVPQGKFSSEIGFSGTHTEQLEKAIEFAITHSEELES